MVEKHSETNPEELVEIQWRDIDFMASLFALQQGQMTIEDYNQLPQFKSFFLQRNQIDNFCRGCDKYRGQDPCTLVAGLRDQTRYVAR